jgi:Zn-dependent peptidase ImmA (M78 family)
MKVKIPVNPEVLIWARQTAGLSLVEVAKKFRKDVDIISSWESGEDTPTYVQLEKLAYQIYKRPLAIFFFPEPPEEETPKQAFRTLPEHEIEIMSSRMHYLLRQARVMKMNLLELNEGENPAEKNIVNDLKFHPDISVEEMAAVVREYLGVNLESQFEFYSVDEALKEWRNVCEANGIYIFKDAFKDEAFSGFCLYDETFPIIYLNNSKAKTRQIFSIFHEMAHLLLGTGGVDTRIEDYIDFLVGDDLKIEILCNRFAGEFLVPDFDFDERIDNITIDEQSLSDLANLYKVSREVILRKFRDRNLVDDDYYSRKANQWIEEARRRPTGDGGNYYNTKKAYLGERYVELAFSKYYQKKISIEQLAGYLDVKVKNVINLEHI